MLSVLQPRYFGLIYQRIPFGNLAGYEGAHAFGRVEILFYAEFLKTLLDLRRIDCRVNFPIQAIDDGPGRNQIRRTI